LFFISLPKDVSLYLYTFSHSQNLFSVAFYNLRFSEFYVFASGIHNNLPIIYRKDYAIQIVKTLIRKCCRTFRPTRSSFRLARSTFRLTQRSFRPAQKYFRLTSSSFRLAQKCFRLPQNYFRLAPMLPSLSKQLPYRAQGYFCKTEVFVFGVYTFFIGGKCMPHHEYFNSISSSRQKQRVS
jgi:hypothetical protein